MRRAGTDTVGAITTVPTGVAGKPGVAVLADWPIGLGITALPVRTVTMIVLIGRGVNVAAGVGSGAAVGVLPPHAVRAAIGTRVSRVRRE